MTRMNGLAIAALLGAAACDSRLTGNEGNFVFSYTADDDVTNFNKPIAVGGMLDIDVTEVGSNAPVTLTSASYDDPAVLDVASMSAGSLTATGVGDGTALLSVEGETRDGTILTDSVNMLASTPEVLILAHTCSTDATAAYITGQRVWVPFELEMDNGQPVIGYGYYPVSLDTSAATLSVADGGQTFMALDTAETAGTVVISSDLDDTTLTMQVSAPAAIDGVQEPIPFVLEDIDVGDVNAFYVRPMIGDLVTCQADVTKTVSSLTPEICDVRDTDALPTTGTESRHEYGWFEIEGLAQGTCEYQVSFPDGGAGATASFSYTIQP